MSDRDGLDLLITEFQHPEIRRRHGATEDVEHEGNALEAEHVIAVGGDLDLQLGRDLLAVHDGAVGVFGIFVELDTEFEAEVLEFLGRESRRGAESA